MLSIFLNMVRNAPKGSDVPRSAQHRARGKIEALTSQLLSSALSRQVWQGDAPVPVELIGETLVGLQLEWQPLTARSEQPRVLAALTAQRVVFLNEAERPTFDHVGGLLRFTIAHEIGHCVLHLDQDVATPAQTDVVCREGERGRREREANFYAAALLMPVPLLEAHLGDSKAISWQTVFRLRARFDVSISAMRHRLSQLGYAVPADSARQVRVRL